MIDHTKQARKVLNESITKNGINTGAAMINVYRFPR